jgi:lysophospholipase L1-like esterase
MKDGCWKYLLPLALGLLWTADVSPSPHSRENSPQPRHLCTDNARLAYRAIEEQISLPPESSVLPVVREDATGQTWAAWEEWAEGRNRVGVGFLKADGILVRRLTSAPEGSDFSPDLAFDSGGSPWATWASYSDLGYRIQVLDMASHRRWSFRPSQKATVANPKIVVDGKGSVRVFWNEVEEKSWRIVLRSFDGDGWSQESEVLRESDVPLVGPDAVSSGQSSIWLAWSGYDGQDFEIFLSRWSGKGWSAALQLTRNGENDLYPALGIGHNGLPVVSWMRPLKEGHRVFAARYDGTQFGPEAPVSPQVRELLPPRTASVAGKTVIVWKSAAGLGTKEVTPDSLAPVERPGVCSTDPPSLFNADRDENAYIGFGDSITYGYIDRLPTPELGYPPRLNVILDLNFGPTEMINEGLGGENTLMGVVRIDAVLGSRPARYILIMEGTNDVINMPVPIDTSVFCLREMIRKAQAAGAFPTLSTIIPRRDWAWPNPQVRARHRYLNEQIRILQAELHVSSIDMDKLFLDYPAQDGGLLSLLCNDLKHPSEKGYQFMAEKWFEEIRNYPFPPSSVEFGDKYPRSDASGGQPEKNLRLPIRPPRSVAGPVGKLLFWKHNPKIFDPARIQGYKIYYQKKDDQGAPFRLFAFVTDASIFMDKGVRVLNGCVYLVSALRDDEVEGPCAGPVED